MSQQTNSAPGVLTSLSTEPDGIAVVAVSGEIDTMSEESSFTELSAGIYVLLEIVQCTRTWPTRRHPSGGFLTRVEDEFVGRP